MTTKRTKKCPHNATVTTSETKSCRINNKPYQRFVFTSMVFLRHILSSFLPISAKCSPKYTVCRRTYFVYDRVKSTEGFLEKFRTRFYSVVCARYSSFWFFHMLQTTPASSYKKSTWSDISSFVRQQSNQSHCLRKAVVYRLSIRRLIAYTSKQWVTYPQVIFLF